VRPLIEFGSDPVILTGLGDYGLGDFMSTRPKAIVDLSGPGGALLPALAIGTEIKNRGFSTRVIDSCASACAYIWLAGRERILIGDVGFHGSFRLSRDGAVHADWVGNNVIIRSYCGTLGISEAACRWLTDPGPEEMLWLDAKLANDVGIKVNIQQSKPPLMTVTPEETARERRERAREDWRRFKGEWCAERKRAGLSSSLCNENARADVVPRPEPADTVTEEVRARCSPFSGDAHVACARWVKDQIIAEGFRALYRLNETLSALSAMEERVRRACSAFSGSALRACIIRDMDTWPNEWHGIRDEAMRNMDKWPNELPRPSYCFARDRTESDARCAVKDRREPQSSPKSKLDELRTAAATAAKRIWQAYSAFWESRRQARITQERDAWLRDASGLR
jgi:hypothetical protein